MRVLITDDYALVREGLRTILEAQPDIATEYLSGNESIPDWTLTVA